MTVTGQVEPPRSPAWLFFVFSLPAKRASERVELWRKLRRIGALALPSSGYVLPNTPGNQEHFEWLAAMVGKSRGHASVIQVHSIQDRSDQQLISDFTRARSADYEEVLSAAKKNPAAHNHGHLNRLRKRFEEIAAIDFFNSPLRSRVESALARADSGGGTAATNQRGSALKKRHANRTWMTRLRPGIDRVSSAWLIRRFIDPNAKFIFGNDPGKHPEAVPFDMFRAGGFGHRGEDCTFETLRKDFGIRERQVAVLAQMIHDADLQDGKFGRSEALGIDRVLIGWAQQGISDEELLRRGMELIEGLYHGIS